MKKFRNSDFANTNRQKYIKSENKMIYDFCKNLWLGSMYFSQKLIPIKLAAINNSVEFKYLLWTSLRNICTHPVGVKGKQFLQTLSDVRSYKLGEKGCGRI